MKGSQATEQGTTVTQVNEDFFTQMRTNSMLNQGRDLLKKILEGGESTKRRA